MFPWTKKSKQAETKVETKATSAVKTTAKVTAKTTTRAKKRVIKTVLSKEAAGLLEYIEQAGAAALGRIDVPTANEAVIAEIRQHCRPKLLSRCAFGQSGQSSIG